MSVRDSLIVNQNTGEEAKEIRNDVDKTGKSVDKSISAAKEEILARVKEAADAGSSSGGVQIFTKNGLFTVPAGVTKILITACGGGGGGGGGASRYWSSSKPSNSGGNGKGGSATVIENLVTLLGGTAGKGCSYAQERDGEKGENSCKNEEFWMPGSQNYKYGRGGTGGKCANTDFYGGDGGTAEFINQKPFAVTPGSTISIVIGSGGVYGKGATNNSAYGSEYNGQDGASGGDGIVIIEW